MVSTLFLSSGDPLLDRRHEWARGLIARGETKAATELLEETLSRAPDFVAGWFLLGEAYEEMNERKQAIAAYRHVLALDRADRLGAALRLARLGKHKKQNAMSPDYVRTLFDQYAARFDNELVESLDYRAPGLLRAALDEIAGEQRFSRVLDLGCGTGLMGEAIRSRAGELLGVDLSPKMIEAAERKKIYDRLAVGDLVEFLDSENDFFDLVLAADVFVYVSDLAPIFLAVSRKLFPGGLLAFTVETHEDEGVLLRNTLRYAHGERYLRAAAAAARFEIVRIEKVSTRNERKSPVAGLLAVFRKPRQAVS